MDEDGYWEEISPNEPRYCDCGDVSYGDMICCENDDVSVCFLPENRRSREDWADHISISVRERMVPLCMRGCDGTTAEDCEVVLSRLQEEAGCWR